MLQRLVAAVLGALIAASPAVAQAPALDAGTSRLTPQTYVYVPKKLAAPAPVVVLLHGAGGDAHRFLDQFTDQANRRGAILIAPQSTGRSWPQHKPALGDPDVSSVSTALAELSARAAIDPRRVVLLGFSDGASWALTLGLSDPKRFPTVVALSPGYAFAPASPDIGQRIFIAHGRRDRMLPPSNVRQMAAGLESAGYRPEVRWFFGGHEIDPDVLNAAFDFALGKH